MSRNIDSAERRKQPLGPRVLIKNEKIINITRRKSKTRQKCHHNWQLGNSFEKSWKSHSLIHRTDEKVRRRTRKNLITLPTSQIRTRKQG